MIKMKKISIKKETRMIFESEGLNISCYSKGYENEITTHITGYLESAMIMLASGIPVEEASKYISVQLKKEPNAVEEKLLKLLAHLEKKGMVEIHESF